MNHEDSDMYDNEHILRFISIPTYQVHTMGSMLFCVDTGIPIPCTEDKALKKIIYSIGRTYIPMIYSERDYQFGDKVRKSKGMIRLFLLLAPGHIQDIPILLGIVGANVPALLGFDVLDGFILLVENVAERLRNRVITNEHPLQCEDR